MLTTPNNFLDALNGVVAHRWSTHIWVVHLLRTSSQTERAKHVFSTHMQNSRRSFPTPSTQLESSTKQKSTHTHRMNLTWIRQHSFPSGPQNITIFVNWHLFWAYQPWTKNIYSVKAVVSKGSCLFFWEELSLHFHDLASLQVMLRHSQLLGNKILKSLLY